MTIDIMTGTMPVQYPSLRLQPLDDLGCIRLHRGPRRKYNYVHAGDKTVKTQ